MCYFYCARERSWLAFSSREQLARGQATELWLRVNVPEAWNRLNLAHTCVSSIVLFNFADDCDVDGFTYKDGEPFYIPQNPIDYSDISCQTCSCNRGETSCQGKVRCDMFTKAPCEKLIPASQGKCCPTCGKFYVKSKTLAKQYSSHVSSCKFNLRIIVTEGNGYETGQCFLM